MKAHNYLWTLLLLGAGVQAQTPPVQLPPSLDPGAVQQQSIERERQRLEEERQRQLREPRTAPLDSSGIGRKESTPAVSAARVLLKRVEFSPSAILSVEELAKIAADYEGREVSFADLQTLIARVNALYKARGAIAAEAVIPAQDISQGAVTIRLVEGRIGSYLLRGNESTSADYVLSRMHAAPGSLVDVATLERDLVWFNRSNDAQLRAELKPGQAFATTDVDLFLTEPTRNAFSLFADNAGSPSTGETRAGVVYTNRSLLGFRDELTLSATGASGYDGTAVSYAVPFNTWGGRFSLAYNDDQTRVKFGPFAPLHIHGAARSWTATARQPLWITSRAVVNASLSVVSRTSSTYIEQLLLQTVDTHETTLGIDGLRADDSGSWSAAFNVSAGTARNPIPDSYTVLRGNLRRDQDLGAGFWARANFGFQATSESSLPSGAQYFIGGVGTVRGYSTAVYSGLQGQVLNLELHSPLFAGNTLQGLVSETSVFAFLDTGRALPVGPGLHPINLQSMGAGVEVRLGSRLFGRLTAAHQMRTRVEESRGNRFDASLVLVPF